MLSEEPRVFAGIGLGACWGWMVVACGGLIETESLAEEEAMDPARLETTTLKIELSSASSTEGVVYLALLGALRERPSLRQS